MPGLLDYAAGAGPRVLAEAPPAPPSRPRTSAPTLPAPPDPEPFLELAEGLHEGFPEASYHARMRGIASKHVLDLVARAPSKYAAWLARRGDEEEAEALIFGRRFHLSILEPERFDKEVLPRPSFGACRAHKPSGTSKEKGAENKRAREAWLIDHGCPADVAEGEADDRDAWLAANTVSLEAIAAIKGMAQSVRTHPQIMGHLYRGQKELTAKWTDRETGIICKARADLYDAREGVILDMKSARDATLEEFSRAIGTLRYYVQDPFYCDGLALCGASLRDRDPFVFVAVEKVPPFDVALFALEDEERTAGRRKYRTALNRFADCLERDTWPGYPETVQRVELKPWQRK